SAAIEGSAARLPRDNWDFQSGRNRTPFACIYTLCNLYLQSMRMPFLRKTPPVEIRRGRPAHAQPVPTGHRFRNVGTAADDAIEQIARLASSSVNRLRIGDSPKNAPMTRQTSKRSAGTPSLLWYIRHPPSRAEEQRRCRLIIFPNASIVVGHA